MKSNIVTGTIDSGVSIGGVKSSMEYNLGTVQNELKLGRINPSFVSGIINSELTLGAEKFTLATIGDQIFWVDYRYLLSITNVNRVDSWNDLGKNGYSWINSGVTRPFIFSDGVGWDHAAVTYRLSTVNMSSAHARMFHDGTPYAIYSVVKVNFVSGAPQVAPLLTTIAFPQQGVQPLIHKGIGGLTYEKDNGTTGETELGFGLLTEAQFCLVKTIYYGDGLSNNVKMQMKSSSGLFTSSVASSSGNATFISLCHNLGYGYDVRFKMITAYNLAGKTVAEINNFDTLFINTLKKDIEYANLIT